MSLPDQSAFNEAAPDADQPRFPHQFFERSVRRFPDRIALDVPPGTGRPARRRLTYAELDRKAEAVAARLRSMLTGAGAPGECVAAILLPRSGAELYAAQLGALKAGAAHAPIDPAFPDEQMRDILEDSDAVAILTDAVAILTDAVAILTDETRNATARPRLCRLPVARDPPRT